MKMPQQSTVDIFSDDIDIEDIKNIPTSNQLNPIINQKNPTAVSKAIPTTSKGNNLDQPNVNVQKKKFPKQVKKKNKKGPAKLLQVQKNIWQVVQPIPSVSGQGTSRQNENPPPIKFDINDRPNLKVVEGTPISIQLNREKNKGLIDIKLKADSNTVQQKEAAKPGPERTQAPNPTMTDQVPTLDQGKPQAPVGRMTASSFMNIQQPYQTQRNQMGWPYNHQRMAGIPRSFLTPAHQAQIQTSSVNTQDSTLQHQAQSSSQGPVWEARIRPQTPSWVPLSRFDQLPNGRYVAQSDDIYGQSGPTVQHAAPMFDQSGPTGQQMLVQTDSMTEPPKQQYSPSDTYADISAVEANDEDTDEQTESRVPGSKRLSAFQRLGPVTQPKKPKLTINLLFNKEQAVREVVDQSDPDLDKYTPVLMRPDIQTSLDDTVTKFITFWPWKKPIGVRRVVTSRESKHIMQLDLEQMDEQYDKEKSFFQVSVTGYPESWNKEDVLDTILEAVKGKSLIPCFIEFTKSELKFLVIRCKAALLAIHKLGFVCHKKDVELRISIMLINLSANQIDFIPRLILRKRLSMAMEGETEINLKQFTLASDISHFIYFPLNRASNQIELMHLQSSVPWEFLTKMVLSHNRIATLSGFDLPHYTPRLKYLDLSYNYLEGITVLLPCRDLPLNSILLEGNPLCADYIELERYTKALKMMFPALKEIDGVKLMLDGEVPETKRNYCPPEAAHVATKVLEVLFPLFDTTPDERQLCEDLYDSNAVMTITFMYKLRYGPIYKDYRALFSRARIMDEGEMDSIEGASAIANIIHRWPILQHDPLTFTVDVLYHTDTTTIMRVSGIVKVTAETLAEDEHMLSFTRTLVLHSLDSVEYKITNEMIYWDLPDKNSAREAFKMTTIKSNNLSLKLDTPPDADFKQKLLEIFMKITDMDQKPSEKCLASKDWHLKNALEYFSQLLKLDNLAPLFD